MVIDPKNDRLIGVMTVKIGEFVREEPSVHHVRSYINNATNQPYHIFKWVSGLSAVNYNKREYDQLRDFIEVSDEWTIYYEEDGVKPFPVSKELRNIK
ncbi:hypothetical protein ACOALA_13550 [Alicyclobacillus acidoterrestris]|uniref:hypothetical protein n=1 Tax=Alicyclobacillus acidoterrestris TaxID=1450 RepID=UPI003F538765